MRPAQHPMETILLNHLRRQSRPEEILGRPSEPALEWIGERGSKTRRRKLWELDRTFHCSIIGTCLTTGELRDVVGRFIVATTGQPLNDHDIHHEGVRHADRSDQVGKLLQRALDQRHAGKIRQFSTAPTASGLLKLWRRHLDDGDVPGAYWAALSHPLASDEVRAQIFGDVHMLSHLVGASNRADIRRLRDLETQEDRLRSGLAASAAAPIARS